MKSLQQHIEEKLIVNKGYDPDNNDKIINVIRDILNSDEQDSNTIITGGKLKEYVKNLVNDILAKDVITSARLTKFLKYIDSNDEEVNDWFNDADCSEGVCMDLSRNRFNNGFVDKIYDELWGPLVRDKRADDFFKTYVTENTFVVFYSCKYKNYIVSFIEDTDEGEILGCIIVKRK